MSAFIVAITALFGCDDEKPYTPFQVATSLPAELPEPNPVKGESSSPVENRADSRIAPPGKSSWDWDDTLLEAPEGLVFSTGLKADIEGVSYMLAWLVPDPERQKKGASEPGLFLFDESGKAGKRLESPSSRLPSGKDCRYTTHLTKSGQETISSTVEVKCDEHSLPDTPNTSVSVIRPKDGAAIFQMFVAESAPGETIDVQVNSGDRDGDGADDIEVTVALSGPKGTAEKLPLRWLSRTAGPSRQANAPLDDLSDRSAKLLTWSIQKAHRAEVPQRVDTVRRLLSAICDELGTPKLSIQNGTKLGCGDLKPQLLRLAQAAIQAQLGLKNLPAAVGELSRAKWFTPHLTSKEFGTLSKPVLPELSKMQGRQLARFDVALEKEAAPHRSQLYFADSGQLFAKLEDTKVKRLTLRGDPPLELVEGEDQERKAKLPEWDLIPHGPGGRYLIAAVPSCERSEVQLAFGRKSGEALPSVPLSVLAPRPGNCRKFSGFQLKPQVLGWDGGQLAVLLAGEVFWTSAASKQATHPVAWGSPLGLLIQDGSKVSQMIVENKADIYEQLHHCVVAPQKNRIACIKEPSVYVFEPL